MITGSHNPPEYNGLKVGLGSATFHGEEIQALRRLAESGAFASGTGTVTPYDVVTPYLNYVQENLRLGSRKLKVVVDAGNGTGGVVAVPLLEALGVEVVPLFIEMDGRFPNHHPDPTVEKNLEDLKAKVLETQADLGIAYDGDADRVGAVDEKGNVLWGDQLMILFSRALLAEQPGAAIVGEVKCSMTLYDDIAKRGGRAIMWKAGPQPHQGEDEGGARAPRRRDERPHLLRPPLVRVRRRRSTPRRARGAALAHRRAALGAARRRAAHRVDAGAAGRLPRGEEVRGGAARPGVLRRAPRGRDRGRRAGRVPRRLGPRRASNTQPLLVLRFEARTKERLAEIEALVRGKVQEILREVGA